MNPLFLNTILLGGDTAAKIAAASAAGFAQIELWRQDVEAQADGIAGVAALLATAKLGLTDYQVLLDFDGAPDKQRDSKRAEALRMLNTAAALGASTVLAPASTSADCVAARVTEDMHWLAEQAQARRLRIAYEGMAWSSVHNTLPSVWQVVQDVAMPNLGLVLDAFHIFARGRDASDMDGIPVDRYFLVQLSDLDQLPDLADRNAVIDIARHHRLLPGEGSFPLSTIIDRLRAGAYAGPIGLEVFNDTLKAADPHSTARAAMAALRNVWPG